MRLTIWSLVAWTLAAAPWAWGQNVQLYGTGTLTPGHLPVIEYPGVLQDAGPSTNGKITSLGLLGAGTPLAINDAPVSGPYHQLAFGANALGGGLITYNAYNGAATLPLTISANGTTFIVGQLVPCIGCGTMASQNANAVDITGGRVNTSTTNGLATLTTTETFPSSLPTALAVWDQNIGSYPTAGLIPAGVLEGIRSQIVVPTSYTQAPWPVTNFSGYCDFQNNTGVGAACVPFFSLAANEGGATAAVYHSNGIITNAPPQFAVSGVGHGSNYGALIGTEINPNVWTKGGGGIPTGDVDGFRAVGGGDVNPSGVTSAYHAFGFSFNTIPWSFGFKGQDACCVVGLDLGAVAVAGNNVNSQGINVHAYNSVGANITATMQHVSTGGVGGTFQLSVPSSGKFGFIVNNVTKTEIGTISFNWLDVYPGTIALNTDITAASNTLPEFSGQFLMRSSTGFTHADTAYKVALASWANCSAGTANCYASNFISSMGAGAGNVLQTGTEININNNNQAYTSSSFGNAAASYGLVLAPGGAFKSTAAIWITDPIATAKLWSVGIGFTADSITEYTLYDATNSSVHDRVGGTHTTVWDAAAATATNLLVGPSSTAVITGTGGVVFAGLPTSAGGGGLNVCVDTAGVFYKKASCP